MKHVIFVTSPPASGKTFIAKQLAKRLRNCVYLDKDAILPLSKRVFAAAGEPYDRSSAFFEENVRNFEYEAALQVLFEAMPYNDTLILNAPFSREIRSPEWVEAMRRRLSAAGFRAVFVWVKTEPAVVKERMLKRGSERDRWKIENFEEYAAGIDFSVPKVDGMFLVENSDAVSYRRGVDRIVSRVKRREGRKPAGREKKRADA